MPSEKILGKKQEQVAELSTMIKTSVSGVLVDYKGISVANDTKLRRELREAGVSYFVIKNSILERAVEGLGYEDLREHLSGTSALAISNEDQIAPARILSKYAEGSKGKFTVKAGYIDGGVINAEKVNELGHLPNREGLLSMLLSAMTGNLRGLAVALNAIAEKNAEPAPVEAAAEEVAPVAEETAPEAPAAE